MADPALIVQTRLGLPLSYALIGGAIMRALDDLGALVHYRPTRWDEQPPLADPQLARLAARPPHSGLPQVSIEPAELFDLTHTGLRIGYTMLEVDGLPDDWVATCNAMDAIWVPSRWGQQIFADAGVSRPIHVVPLGYDPQIFHVQPGAQRTSPRYTFLSVFAWSARKGPDLLLRAYRAAFAPSDDVLLLIHTDAREPELAQVTTDLDLAAGPPVVLLHGNVPRTELGRLYASADCFVLPTRGEGFGLPILEAMACGLPVIATDWSGQTAFFDASVGYPIRVKQLVPTRSTAPHYFNQRWAEPDFDQLVDLMRQMYRDPAAARARGVAAAAAAPQWTWQRTAQRICAELAR